MSKNKYIYGAVCKSQPVPNPGAELTENLPETKWKAAQKQLIKKANFLFFQIFVSLVILMMPTTLWADLISLTVDSGGDNVFRGEVDRLRIIFTVDDSDEEDPYIVEVGTGIGTEDDPFNSRGVIEQGIVSADETVNVFWDGTIDGAKLPDDTYTIRVTVDDGDDAKEVLYATAILDSSAPRVSGVLANGDPEMPITEGSFISAERLQSIVVAGADDGGADNGNGLDLANRRNTIFLRNAQQAVVRGTLLYHPRRESTQNQPEEDASLTFTLVDPLDDPSENGTYTLILILIDKAGNVVQSLREFTFDNVEPRLRRVSTNRGGLIPGGGVSQRLNYVEAVLADNLEDGIDLFASTIYLDRIGTDGPTRIPGEKTEDAGGGRIRWTLLTPLLGRDDSQDGEYIITVTAVDKAGNKADDPVRVSFRYDNRAPSPTLVRPMGSPEDFTFNPFPDTNYYNLPITGFVVAFEDAGIGVDLAGRRQSTQIVFGIPKESGEGVNVLEGQVITDDDSGTLTYILNQPIVSRDGTQDGHYLLNIQATDTAGNTKVYDYQIVYDTQRPTLVSTTPASNETVSALSQVEVKLDEKTSGIDFVQSNDFQLWKGRATDVLEDATREQPVARAVPVNIASNGMDTVTLTLLKPIALDGSDDGAYTIKVTPTDRAGNTSGAAVREFYLVSQKHEPEIRLAVPQTTRVNSLMTVGVELIDYVGAGIDFDASSVSVTNSQGVLVPQEELEHTVGGVSNPDSLTWTAAVPVARDGSADGEYIVTATFVDFTGRRFTQEFPIVLDTQIPALVSTVPAANETVSELSRIEVKLSENTSGIDFAQSTFQLTRGDAEVPVNITSGTDTVTLTLAAPIALDGSDDGTYAIRVTPTDRAGNIGVTVVREFYLVSQKHEPEIRLTMPETTIVNTLPTVVVVELIDYVGAGIDFDASTLSVRNSQGVLVPEEKLEHSVGGVSNPDSLTWNTLYTAPRDGSADGEYTITATFVDFTERRFTQEFSIVLDTQTPTFVSTVPAANETVSQLSRVQVRLSENTSGIDFVQSTFRLTRGDVEVPVNITSNGTGAVTLTLAAPIALDGSDDGTYTIEVTPTDRAGNTGATALRKFYLVGRKHEPEIRLTMPEATRLSNLATVVVELVDYVGAGIDFDASTVTVRNPQGGLVPQEELEHDEASNQLTWTAAAPFARDGSADGEYTITATFVDWTRRRFTQRFPIVLDTRVPEIENVHVKTSESETELSTDTITAITENFSQILVTFQKAAVSEGNAGPSPVQPDIDFTNTVIELTGPEAAVPINISIHSATQLAVRFVELMEDGVYTLAITPQDIVGNTARGAVHYAFLLDTEAPRITEPTPLIFNQRPVTYIGSALRQFQFAFTVEDVGPAGLYLEEQTLEVLDASGANIPVAVTRDELTNQLFLALPASFPRDGSVDGEYTAKISLVDKAGNRSDSEYTIVYDSKAPQVASAVVNADPPMELVLNRIAKIVEPINSITLQFEEATQIDFATTQVTLMGPESTPSIPLTLEDDGVSQLTLSFLDLEQVGTYTLSVTPQDVAGNTAAGAVDYRFVLDMPVPQLTSVVVDTAAPVELVPNRVPEIVEPINSITLQFEGTRQIDFANTQITLMGPEGSDESGVSTTPSISLMLENDGVSQVTLSFLDLEQLGSYILSVTPQDVAGNVGASLDYRFILDIPLPRVSSVVIGGIETEAGSDVVYVNADNMIIGAFLLDPTETGLSFGSEGSDITVVDSTDTVVPGGTGSNGEDLIVWEPITLTSDGTTDGRYSVYITPVDKAGRQGSMVYREFIYDTQEPEIQAAEPINLSQPVSYSSQSLTQFSFTIADIGPADLELSDQKVTLRDASGGLVPTQLTNDTENQLFLTLDQPLPLDGSMDGEYTVLVELADKAGNSYTVEHLIVYDTQAPTLVSTVPADGALLTEDVTQIQVTLNDEGGSGIDWAVTTVMLVNPTGEQISGELVSDGETALTLTTNQLVGDGRYIIRVQAVDRAGNGDAVDFERSFLLSRYLPTIISTEPTTAPADEAFMNEELERIEVTLETDDENHLSTLRLLNPGTQVVAGQLQRANDRLVYNLIRSLATDGSDDGVYTIEFTPISASGRSGEVKRLTFTYDTQAPEIEPDEAISLVVAEPEVNNSLTEIHVNLTDETSGIDWKNLDEKWLTFERLSPNPTKLSGRISDDGQDNLTFRLTVPLADNGSADGEYRIILNPKDRAGNDDESYEKVFIYDTSPPMIDPSTLLINDAPLLVDINAENYPTAVSTTGGVAIQANIFDTGLGVNLAQSKIIVTSPDGSEVSGNTQQNGVDTLIFKSDGLTIQGVYKVTVMSIGNDSELLGFAPTDSLTTEFLYETTVPTAAITSDGGETELTDKALPLEGTASDPSGTQRTGDSEIPVPASGVWIVEIVGTGPDKQPIDPVAAVDDSNAEQEPWSVWSIDFLPTRSGEYDLDVRVTDNAGNYEVYDIGEYTMSVSLTFRGTTFGWPNPLRLSKRDVAFFSFDVNVPRGETIELTLSIYDWSGDMVLSETYPDVVSGQRNDQLVKWNLENQAGASVARGIYVFRLEAINSAGNHANVVGKVLVVD